MVHQKFRKWFGKEFAEIIKIIAIVIGLALVAVVVICCCPRICGCVNKVCAWMRTINYRRIEMARPDTGGEELIELDDLNYRGDDDMVINIDEENEGRDTTLNEEMPKIKKRRSISIPSLRRQSGKSVSFKVLD